MQVRFLLVNLHDCCNKMRSAEVHSTQLLFGQILPCVPGRYTLFSGYGTVKQLCFLTMPALFALYIVAVLAAVHMPGQPLLKGLRKYFTSSSDDNCLAIEHGTTIQLLSTTFGSVSLLALFGICQMVLNELSPRVIGYYCSADPLLRTTLALVEVNTM